MRPILVKMSRIVILLSSFTIKLSSGKKEEVIEAYQLRPQLTRKIDCDLGLKSKAVKDAAECPVDGAWSNWSPWSECHGSCGQPGVRRRQRKCDNPPPRHNGAECFGDDVETKLCHLRGCTVQEYYEAVECDDIRLKEFDVLTRVHEMYPALVPRCIEAECHYQIVQDILRNYTSRYWTALHCIKHNNGCPVVGGWSEWGPWSPCSSDCGQGEQLRCRTCTNPVPPDPEYNCKGDNCTRRACSGINCDTPKYGSWSDWSSWTVCSESCGQGLSRKYRECIHNHMTTPRIRQPSDEGGCGDVFERFRIRRHLDGIVATRLMCNGPREVINPCFRKDCPVDGDWSEWEPWSPCSVQCSLGFQSRSRACSSPPPIAGGKLCEGPVTWIRPCFEAPCQDKTHESASFLGDGFLSYYKTGQPCRLLHIYLKFKSSDQNGVLIRREEKTCEHEEEHKNAKCDRVSLMMKAGYFAVIVRKAGCSLSMTTLFPVQLETWHKVFVVITGTGATMRLDDSNEVYTKQFHKCTLSNPDFDSDMTVGRTFKGSISEIVINFVPRNLRIGYVGSEKGKSNVSPNANHNIAYSLSEADDVILDLDQLIFSPCFKNMQSWTIHIVIKTGRYDGAILLVRDYYLQKYLYLYAEPHRIVLRLEDGACRSEIYQEIEDHVGKWLLIVVNYNDSESIGMQINGGKRKRMNCCVRNDYWIRCKDNILIGQVSQIINNQKKNTSSRFIGHMKSMAGKLAYLKVDGEEIDLKSLPAEKMNSPCKQFSSSTASRSKKFTEIKLRKGEPFKLSCSYYSDETSEDIYAKSTWNKSRVIWLHLDTPIVHMKRMSWNVKYEILDNNFLTILRARKFNRSSIEGVYSCYLPSNVKSQANPILVTYGVTVIDPTTGINDGLNYNSRFWREDFKGARPRLLAVISILLGVCAVVIIGSLIYEYIRGMRLGLGIFTMTTTVKKHNRMSTYIIMHSPQVEEIFGVRNKLKNLREKYKTWEIGKENESESDAVE